MTDSETTSTKVLLAADEKTEGMIDLTKSGDRGILKKVIKEGNSEISPCNNDVVIVHYVGTYFGGDEDGKEFDSSRKRNEKFKFTIGKGEVIKAWDIGVATMKLGEVCELIAAPEYAYNDGKAMKFEIELFETQGQDISKAKNGSVRKSILRGGRDIHNPVVGATATIKFRCISEADDEHEETYCVGDPTPQVPVALDLAVRTMNTDEFSRIVVDENGIKKTYEITLKTFQKTKRLSSLSSFSEQMEYANTLKEKGNSFLKESKYDSCIELYDRLEEDLRYIVANGPSEEKVLNEMIVAIQLNLSLVYLKLANSEKCMEFCKKVLDVNINNEKALFRLGQAHLLRKDHEEAVGYFEKVVKVNPENSAAINQLNLCRNVIQKAKDMELKMYRNVFERYKDIGLGSSNSQVEPAPKEETSAA